MSERDLALAAEPVDVVVGPNPTQQVVLVEAYTAQGIPGPIGPPGPPGPPISTLPVPDPALLDKAAFVRDLGAGPVWTPDYVQAADVERALGYVAANADGQDFRPGNVAASTVEATTVEAGTVVADAVETGSVEATAVRADEVRAGADREMVLRTNAGVYAQSAFKDGLHVFHCDLPTGNLQYYAAGNVVMGLDSLGNVHFPGAITGGSIVPTDLSVTTGKLADGAVTTGKLADGAVTGPKLGPNAAASNIGYTPANKAGEVFTGQINAPSVVSPGIVGTEIYAGADADVQIHNVPGVSSTYRFTRLGVVPVAEFTCALPTGRLEYRVGGTVGLAVAAGGISAPRITADLGLTAAEVIFGLGTLGALSQITGATILSFKRTAPTSSLYHDHASGMLDYYASGSTLPVVRFSGSGQVTAYGDRIQAAGTSVVLFSDGLSYTQIVVGPGALIQFSWATKTYVFYNAAGFPVMSLDAAGNMRVKGTVTPNVAPAEFEAALIMPPPDPDPPPRDPATFEL